MRRRSPLLLTGAAITAVIISGMLLDSLYVIDRVQAYSAESNEVEQSYRELQDSDHSLWEGSRILEKIAKLNTPAVVHIQSTQRNEHRGTIQETGSGVLVSSLKAPGVFIVTNRHVLNDAPLKSISIHLNDGRVVHPTRMWSDPATDLSVLKVEADNLQTARWGDSDRVQIGHGVLAMGSPFGLNHSVTYGIISAKGRRSLKLRRRSGAVNAVINQDFLQTDAAINPGNSGGPLINLRGQVIGINTAIASNSGRNEGIGFSIPSNLVRRVVDDLLEYGKVYRAYLGVTLDSHFGESKARQLHLDRLRGARVIEVHSDTPASRAHIQFNDVILEFNNIEVLDENHLIHLVSLTPIHDQARLLILRDGKRFTISVQLDDRSELERRSEVPKELKPGRDEIELMHNISPIGLSLSPLDGALKHQLGFGRQTNGLLVLNVETDDSGEHNLQLYDVIIEAARKPVLTVEDLHRIFHKLPSNQPVVLKVHRYENGKTQTRLVIWRSSNSSDGISTERDTADSGIET